MDEQSSGKCVKAVRWIGGLAVVDVQGDVDLSRSGEFQQSLLAVLDKKPERIVVNLAGVQYMDSSGVAGLVKLMGKARQQQVSFCLAALADRVRGIFEITRLDTIFEIHPTVEEALA